VSQGPIDGAQRAASVSRRVWAYLIDGVPVTLLIDAAIFGLNVDLMPWGLFTFFVTWQVYFVAFWSLGGGQTPGMRLLGIRVVRVDGAPLDARRALGRSLVWFFGSFGAVAPMSVLISPDHRGLHDRATDTHVIRIQAG